MFEAWSKPGQIRRWAAPAQGWQFDIADFDFRVGGGASFAFGPTGEVPYVDTTRYDDIVPDRRIVTAYAIAKGAMRISLSVSCLECVAQAGGTLLRVTETGVFLDGSETVATRKGGVAHQLSQLADYIGAR